jgi:hypothetical protein
VLDPKSDAKASAGDPRKQASRSCSRSCDKRRRRQGLLCLHCVGRALVGEHNAERPSDSWAAEDWANVSVEGERAMWDSVWEQISNAPRRRACLVECRFVAGAVRCECLACHEPRRLLLHVIVAFPIQST